MLAKIDMHKCPLCGKNNDCMANSSDRCWCHDVTVPQALLDLVPTDLSSKACICRSCIKNFNDYPVEFIAKML